MSPPAHISHGSIRHWAICVGARLARSDQPHEDHHADDEIDDARGRDRSGTDLAGSRLQCHLAGAAPAWNRLAAASTRLRDRWRHAAMVDLLTGARPRLAGAGLALGAGAALGFALAG